MKSFRIFGLVFIVVLYTGFYFSEIRNKKKELNPVPVELNSIYVLSKQNAHPNAVRLFTDEFYWNEPDEISPFGNDNGWDALQQFVNWRKLNKQKSCVDFVNLLFKQWGFPEFNIYTLDTLEIRSFVLKIANDSNLITKEMEVSIEKSAKEMAEDVNKPYNKGIADSINRVVQNIMGYISISSMDDAIIATGFGQYLLEGKIDKDILELSKIALKRQLIPDVTLMLTCLLRQNL